MVPAVCGSDPAIRADGAFVLDLVKVRGGLGLGFGVRVRFRVRVWTPFMLLVRPGVSKCVSEKVRYAGSG